jgi:3-oxoacyl-[acyl-carrier-protein] synthase III
MAFGDGAAATIVSASLNPGFVDFFRMTDGEEFDAGFFEDYKILIIDRKRVAEFAPLAFKLAVDGILKETGITLDDISLIVPHQAGSRIIQAGMKLSGIPEVVQHLSRKEGCFDYCLSARLVSRLRTSWIIIFRNLPGYIKSDHLCPQPGFVNE